MTQHINGRPSRDGTIRKRVEKNELYGLSNIGSTRYVQKVILPLFDWTGVGGGGDDVFTGVIREMKLNNNWDTMYYSPMHCFMEIPEAYQVDYSEVGAIYSYTPVSQFFGRYQCLNVESCGTVIDLTKATSMIADPENASYTLITYPNHGIPNAKGSCYVYLDKPWVFGANARCYGHTVQYVDESTFRSLNTVSLIEARISGGWTRLTTRSAVLKAGGNGNYSAYRMVLTYGAIIPDDITKYKYSYLFGNDD